MAADNECRFEGLLNLRRERAFALFVDRPDLWWSSPFSEPGKEQIDAGIEPLVGGSCYEVDHAGHQKIWGTVLSIESPLYVRLAWQISLEGDVIADPATASRVVVSFREVGETTLLEIVHSEFLRHGERGGEVLDLMRQSAGWPRIIDNLQNAAKNVK
jgi:activator of Hsp90 ATPase-like protein